jgi:hypothetical protein
MAFISLAMRGLVRVLIASAKPSVISTQKREREQLAADYASAAEDGRGERGLQRGGLAFSRCTHAPRCWRIDAQVAPEAPRPPVRRVVELGGARGGLNAPPGASCVRSARSDQSRTYPWRT